MYFQTASHNGSPEFMLAVLALLVALVMSQTVRGSGIAQHPYTKPHDGGDARQRPAARVDRPAGVRAAPRRAPRGGGCPRLLAWCPRLLARIPRPPRTVLEGGVTGRFQAI